MPADWKVVALADGPEVFLYGEIWSGDALAIYQQIVNSKADRVHLRINSVGGDVFEALALYNMLKTLTNMEIVAHIDGTAMSAATLVACGCTRVLMASNAIYMIHNPSSGSWGDSEDHEKTAAVLRAIEQQMAVIYADRTGRETTELLDMMNDELYLGAEDALAFGFIDEIEGSLDVAAIYKPTRFATRPHAQTTNNQEDKQMDEKEKQRLLELEKENGDLRAQLAQANENAAKAEVDALIVAGKLSESRRDLALKLYTSDSESFKALVATEPAPAPDTPDTAAFDAAFTAAVKDGKALPAQREFAAKAFAGGLFEAWLSANNVVNLNITTHFDGDAEKGTVGPARTTINDIEIRNGG